MASTPLLGLSLPADGTTNWGTLVNTSITALLDSAVAGTTTLSSDADVTLTATTEATNQARQAIILWNATGTVTRNITAPAQSKTYVVINATGGTQSIVFRATGPTTGVTIPAGKAYMLAWNGADFVTTGVTTVNLATDVTGILAGVNGGTGVNNTGKTITLGGNLTTSGAFDTTLTTSAATNVTLPTTGTLATLAGNEALTNKTISGSSNTLSNIANASLTNSSITINGNAVSLGGSTTVTATATNALTIGTGLSGGSYNGSAAVTVALATGYGDTLNPYASKTANFVLAAPDGSAGVPTFRAIVAADIPTLNQNTTGTAAGLSATLAIGSGGTGATTAQGAINALAGAVTSGQYLRGNGTNVVMSAIQAADVPTLNQNTTGNANTATTATNLSGGIVRAGIASVASAATITPTSDTVNQYNVTALAVPANIAAPSGTPVDGQKLIIRFKDNGTARALTWNAIYRVIGSILPATTVATKTTYVGCIYNAADAVWDVVAVTTQA